MDNPEEMDRFLEKFNLPRLNQEEKEIMLKKKKRRRTKKKQTNKKNPPNITRRKEIIKIQAEISEK